MTKWIIKLIPKFIKTWFLNLLYDDIASKGINGDTELAYLNKQQQSFLKSIGGSGTLNPYTGCKQYFGPLAIGLAVGTAAFGIAKLAGLSTKKALGIGLLGGLGAGGIKALMAAPTATGVSNATVGLAEAAGAGSTAAGQAASQLAASYWCEEQLVLWVGAAAKGIGGGPALGTRFIRSVPLYLHINSSTCRHWCLRANSYRVDLVPCEQSWNIYWCTCTHQVLWLNQSYVPDWFQHLYHQLKSRCLGQAGQFVKENPFTTIAGGGTLLSYINQPKTPTYDTTNEEMFPDMEGELYKRERARTEPFSDRAVYEKRSRFFNTRKCVRKTRDVICKRRWFGFL